MKSGIEGIKWIELVSSVDDRGTLTSIESASDIPFEIKRVFYMHHVVSNRGGHAHLDTDQVVIGIAGCHVVEVKDNKRSKTFVIDDPNRGLYLPRMTFARLIDFTPDAVSLVLSSTHYDRSKSIRTFEEYLSLLSRD